MGGINPQTGCILLGGNIRMLGEGSGLTQLSVGDLDVSGNVAFDSLSIAGNITSGGNFIGNGSMLTDVLTNLPSRANIDIVGNVDGTYANVSNLSLSSTFIALGDYAGADNQQPDAIAIGYQTGSINQGSSTVAVGTYAGRNDQGVYSTAMGAYAGNYFQGQQSVAAGLSAGEQYQGEQSVAIGSSSGQFYQGNGAVAIGASAGYDNQGANSVAIGTNAGFSFPGNNSVSIGSYGTARGANSVVINATGTSVVNLINDTFVVKPVRGNIGNVNKLMMYDTTSGEITYNTSGYIGNVTTGQVNVTGNAVLSPGKSVFASQMPFFLVVAYSWKSSDGSQLDRNRCDDRCCDVYKCSKRSSSHYHDKHTSGNYTLERNKF